MYGFKGPISVPLSLTVYKPGGKGKDAGHGPGRARGGRCPGQAARAAKGEPGPPKEGGATV